MIFPDIRISELEKDVESSRRAFQDSQELFALTLRQKTRPLTFLGEHPKIIFSTLLTAFSSVRFLFTLKSIFLGKGKSSFLWKILKAGWMWKLLKVGASALYSRTKKKDFGILGSIIQSALKNVKF